MGLPESCPKVFNLAKKSVEWSRGETARSWKVEQMRTEEALSTDTDTRRSCYTHHLTPALIWACSVWDCGLFLVNFSSCCFLKTMALLAKIWIWNCIRVQSLWFVTPTSPLLEFSFCVGVAQHHIDVMLILKTVTSPEQTFRNMISLKENGTLGFV